MVNQELRELTLGTHGAELNLPDLEDGEPTDPGFLSFDDDDSDDIWDGDWSHPFNGFKLVGLLLC